MKDKLPPAVTFGIIAVVVVLVVLIGYWKFSAPGADGGAHTDKTADQQAEYQKYLATQHSGSPNTHGQPAGGYANPPGK